MYNELDLDFKEFLALNLFKPGHRVLGWYFVTYYIIMTQIAVASKIARPGEPHRINPREHNFPE